MMRIIKYCLVFLIFTAFTSLEAANLHSATTLNKNVSIVTIDVESENDTSTPTIPFLNPSCYQTNFNLKVALNYNIQPFLTINFSFDNALPIYKKVCVFLI